MDTLNSSEFEGISRSTKLGDKLKQLREDCHCSLKTVESITRVSSSHINRVEKSERIPSLKVLHALALCYGVDLSELIKIALTNEEVTDFCNPRVSPCTRHMLIELIKVISLNNLDYFDSMDGIKALAVAAQNFLNSVKNDGIDPKIL